MEMLPPCILPLPKQCKKTSINIDFEAGQQTIKAAKDLKMKPKNKSRPQSNFYLCILNEAVQNFWAE